MQKLNREEYVEQAYFFQSLGHRLSRSEALQDILENVREEVLATTKLPMAIDFLKAEIGHSGMMSTAMTKLGHYFSAFQTFVVASAEDERGRFDLHTALEVLRYDAEFRAKDPSPVATFFYQFETLCRNRLDYVSGLDALVRDPSYDEAWQEWLILVRKQIGLIELTDLVYVSSEHYVAMQQRRGQADLDLPEHVLFGEKEGKIALANRHKEPLLFFEALQRQLDYPKVPRLERKREDPLQTLGGLMRRMERMESRLKLLEDEQRDAGIDLSKFYKGDDGR